ncbi:MAG: hypothetical protein H8E13_15390 [Actinobacteria bacterium]|nr:hypothetical protein [Actinomycetota bacterium]
MEIIKDYYHNTCRKDGGNPAAVAVIQTFGDYLSFNSHMYFLLKFHVFTALFKSDNLDYGNFGCLIAG